MNFYYRQWWNDYRLIYNDSYGDITLATPPSTWLWVPDITFMNAKEVEIVHTAERTIVNSSGDVYISQRYLVRTFIESRFLNMSLIILQIWSHLLKKSLMENFIFCAVCRHNSLTLSIMDSTSFLSY